MSIQVGNVVEGVVTGITNFGAFVDLEGGKTGLVHISEISHDYVNKVEDYVKKGQKIKVKIISISQDGKLSLSIRQAEPKKKPSKGPAEIDWNNRADDKSRRMSFEDKLNQFLKDSGERQEQLKRKDSRRGYSQKNR